MPTVGPTRTAGFLAGAAIARPFVAMTVAATDNTLFTLPASRRCRMTKFIGWNGSTGDAQWLIGYTTAGGVFTQVYPIIMAPVNVNTILNEADLPQFEFTTGLGAAIIIRTNIGAATQQVMCEILFW